MENVNKEASQTCPKCGSPVAQVDVLSGTGTLVLTKPRSAITLGIMRGSSLQAHTCTACGYTELYASNPEVLQ